MKKIGIVALILISLWAIGESFKKEAKNGKGNEGKTTISHQYFGKRQIAMAAISGIMGRPLQSIKAEVSNNVFLVSYIRKNDNQLFSYKVKVHENKIGWGSSDGRWRQHKLDEKITYSMTENKLKIIETHFDGSASEFIFTQKDFIEN